LRGAEIVAAIVCLVGLGLSAWLLPEPKGLSLEQLEEQARAPRASATLKPVMA
jgi:hypothetical protein